MKKTLALLLPLLLSGAALAKDYGVHGNVWEITEVDIRKVLMTEVAQADWEGPKKELQESAKNYLSNLPKRFLPEPAETSIAWFDPSFVLQEDIKVPFKRHDGEYAWRVLYAAGSKVNPLETISPATAMFFFDGSVPEQVELVKKVLKLEPNRIVPVEAGAGDLQEVNEQLGRGAFHANDAMIARFEVKYLPTLLYPGKGDKRTFLAVHSFARPFDETAVVNAWIPPTFNPNKK